MLNKGMKISESQYSEISAGLRDIRDLKAGQIAVKAQLAELHTRLSKILDQLDDTNAHISFQRRPKP